MCMKMCAFQDSLILVLYIDDILLASYDLGMIYETKEYLRNNFDMKDMCEATFITGIEIYRDRSRGLLGLSQETYIKNVLKRFHMEGCKAQNVPMSKGDRFVKNDVQEMKLKGNRKKLVTCEEFEWTMHGTLLDAPKITDFPKIDFQKWQVS